jgi:hypothetical protein
MNDFMHTDDPEARAVLDGLVNAARAEQPGSRSMQRTVVALGLGAATATVSATATAAAAATAGKSVGAGLTAASIIKAAALGIAVGAVALGTAATTGMLSSEPEAPTRAAASSADVTSQARAHREPAALRPAQVAEVEPESEVAAEKPAPLGQGARQAAAGSARAAAAPSDGETEPVAQQAPASGGETSLGAEVRTLEAARSEIAAGRSPLAVAILDRYRREFPAGRLALEAEVLRIESLFRSGRAATAIGLANKVLAANPQSPLAARVRAIVRQPPAAEGAP